MQRCVIEKRTTPEQPLRDACEEPGPPKISVCGFFERINLEQRLKDGSVCLLRSARFLPEFFI
jgi:hypothetical protein